MPEDELLTAAQAAERLQVNRRSFSRWVKTGRITPAYVAPGVTGTRLFRVEDIDRLAESIAPAGDAA